MPIYETNVDATPFIIEVEAIQFKGQRELFGKNVFPSIHTPDMFCISNNDGITTARFIKGDYIIKIEDQFLAFKKDIFESQFKIGRIKDIKRAN